MSERERDYRILDDFNFKQNRKGIRYHILFCAKLFVLFTTNIAAHIGVNLHMDVHRPSCVLKRKTGSGFSRCWSPFLSHLTAFHPVAPHYSRLLQTEGVTELVRTLAAQPDTHSDVQRLSEGIVQMVEEQQSRSMPSNAQTGPSNS